MNNGKISDQRWVSKNDGEEGIADGKIYPSTTHPMRSLGTDTTDSVVSMSSVT